MRGLVLSLFALPAFAGDIPHLSEAQARVVGLSSDGKAYAFRVVSTFVDAADRGFCKYPDGVELRLPSGRPGELALGASK